VFKSHAIGEITDYLQGRRQRIYIEADCSRYWDSEVDPANYSFVDFAISQGYSVFFYDRLGTGESSK
jgi:hypothetical protein